MRLRPYLPRAPGARMTAVTQTPSNKNRGRRRKHVEKVTPELAEHVWEEEEELGELWDRRWL